MIHNLEDKLNNKNVIDKPHFALKLYEYHYVCNIVFYIFEFGKNIINLKKI